MTFMRRIFPAAGKLTDEIAGARRGASGSLPVALGEQRFPGDFRFGPV